MPTLVETFRTERKRVSEAPSLRTDRPTQYLANSLWISLMGHVSLTFSNSFL